MARNVAVILAGGTGERAGLTGPKQLARLGGHPVVAHALAAFQAHPRIDEIAIVANAACLNEIEALVEREGPGKVRRVLPGGRERPDSARAAILAYAPDAALGPLNLLIHDAARPLVDGAIIGRVTAALERFGAVCVAVPSADTVLLADPATGVIRDVPDRAQVRLAQTPQGFRYDVIATAYDRAGRDPDFRATDDCGVVLRYLPEEPVHVVDGARRNLKLTYSDDLMLLELYLARAPAGVERGGEGP